MTTLTRQQIIEIAICPTCHAHRGEPCRRTKARTHYKRMWLAQDLANGQSFRPREPARPWPWPWPDPANGGGCEAGTSDGRECLGTAGTTGHCVLHRLASARRR